MNKIRKGDTVIINAGKDKGKQGIVLKLDGSPPFEVVDDEKDKS